ncbi:hypothetical protein OG21DRAFT_1500556 [Imleria badia]|nr:hypothetical protein OG21DRAFT_1500556 [Imleria badia]
MYPSWSYHFNPLAVSLEFYTTVAMPVDTSRLKCRECGVRTRNLTTHVRTTHQMEVVLRHNEFRTTIQRTEDGLFHCLCGEYSDRNPDRLRSHFQTSCATHRGDNGLPPTTFRDEDSYMSSSHDDGQRVVSDNTKGAVSKESRVDGVDESETRFNVHTGSSDDEDHQTLHNDIEGAFVDEEEECFGFDNDTAFNPKSRVVASDEYPPTTISHEIVSMHCDTLSRSGLHVDLVHGLIICLECSEALDYRHIRAHVITHSLPYPSDEQLAVILRDLNIGDSPSLSPFQVIAPIAGLQVVDGLVCTFDSCGFPLGSKSSLQRHHQESHPAAPLSYESCKIHRIFAFRGHQLVVRVDPSLAVQRLHGTLADYLSVICPTENVSTRLLDPSDDPRKTTSFLHSARWLDVIRGHPLDRLLSLVAIPSGVDMLCPVVEEINTMFTCMWDIVDTMEVLPRRHIHTPKGNLDSADLDNKPFSRPQTKEYLLRCASHWGRYICALLRSLDAPSPLLSLSPRQHEYCQSLRRTLVEHGNIRQALQSLSFAMLSTYAADVQRDNFLCPLMRFIVFWHLRDDGTFQPPSLISPDLASLTFCFRSIAILEASHHMQLNPSLTFMGYYQDTLLPLLKEGYPTPFNSLRQLTHLVSAHAYNSTKLPDMHWNQLRDTLCVKGFPLKIDLIPEMTRSLCVKAESILEKLLLGVPRDAFDRIVDVALNPNDPAKWPVDPLRNTDEGFSFVHSRDNSFFPYLRMVLEHIHSDPSVFDTYHFVDNQGCFLHKHGPLRAYLHLYREFIDILMVLVHMATPGVARGSELGPLRSTNSIDGPRNFFFLAGSCAIICQYTKTRSITGKDGFVAHFLPKAVSRLFIYLVGPIREVIMAFSRITFPDSHSVYKTYLYVVNGKTIDSSAFSNVLRAYTLEYLRIPLTLAPFRQAVKALLRNVLHYHEELDPVDDAVDACFGHSSVTGNTRYGLVYDDLPGLTENMYVDALRLASLYHSWLGLASSPPPSHPSAVVQSPSSLEHMASRIERVLPALEEFRDRGLSDLAVVENRIIEKCLPIVQDTIMATLSRQVPWSTYLRIPPPSSRVTETILIHQSRVGHLRSLFKRPDVYFKSLQQGEAIEVVFRRNPHVLVVLPTGGGKSAVYQAPCFSAENGFRVVLVPYISLMEQALSDASEKGIPHAVWSSSTLDTDIFRVKLVFAAAEQVAKERFREWLRASFDTGYLNGIVVDEAHDILLSRDYRETFCEFTCLGDIGCQIVLLSATISPSVEPILWRSIGIDTQHYPVHVIRGITTRPDIHFMVSQVPQDSLQTFTVRLLERHIFQSPLDRGIVYCETVEDATVLANLVDTPLYVGPMAADARSVSLRSWLSGRSRWLCATSAFAQGIDYGHVTYVLHYRIPKHITLYAQQSGRLARRSGVVGVSHLVYSQRPLHRHSSDDDFGGFNAMVDLVSKDQCRRLSITGFLDVTPSNCYMLGPCQLCDFCAHHHAPLPATRHPQPLPRLLALNTERSSVHSPPFPPSIPSNPIRSPDGFSSLLRSSRPPINPTRRSPIPNTSNVSRNVPLGGEIPRAFSLPKAQKEAIVFRFLQECEGMCIVHVLVGGDASHKFFSCAASRTFFSAYKAFRSQIFYSKPGICYRCGVLTSDRFDHPFRSKGDKPACKYDDILKPLAFGIFSVPSLKDIVIPGAGGRLQDFHSVGDYAKWLGNVSPGSQSMFNLWEVCHSYVHLLNDNRIPAVCMDDLLASFSH